ncbi:MAG: toll/interleukin-1 receptor domain-containing protein [Terracidiphilus sp.]
MATLFFSYSHADEALRDQLEIHLSSLKRRGIISTWHDRRILVGTEFDKDIDQNLDNADVILFLVSPDFIASDYCHEREVKRALQRHSEGNARVIPVILRPCDWHDLEFGSLLATPTDGRAITKWPNSDEAFLDVVKSIKTALQDLGRSSVEVVRKQAPDCPPPSIAPFPQQIRSSNLRVSKSFSDLDKDRFRQEGFEYIANFFENSMKEVSMRNSELEFGFRRIDTDRFTATLYRVGDKVCKGSARLGGRSIGREGIEYSMSDDPHQSGMNEALYVKADSQSMYFEPLGMQSYGQTREKLTYEGAAELLWAVFIGPLQN